MLVLTSLALSLVASALAAAFPQQGSSLTAPTGAPKFVGLGVGTQNYTCADTGAYASAGAVATLYDISCIVDTPMYDSISDIAIDLWTSGSPNPGDVCKNSRINAPTVLGQHYFITNPVTGSGISPMWNFGSAGSVVAAKTGNMAAPTGSNDVDWLALNAVEGQGTLASQIFRVDTREGQPPASCEVGSDPITVKYTALYCEYPLMFRRSEVN
ncbi:hypothetical protein CPB85DRAFT_1375454 [Mucidula mucida]|nr:hypothetical protein CPB85DRAFT_1375454 [Mucidula mucida]